MPEHHALTGGEARSCEGFNDTGKSCAQMDNCCKSCDPITWEFNFQLALVRVHFTVTLTLTNTPNTHTYICLGFRTDHNYMDLSAAFLTACLGLKPTKRFPLSILYLDILGHFGIDCAALQSLPPNLPVLRGCTLLLMGGLSLSKAVVNFMTLMKVLLVAWSAEWMMVMSSWFIYTDVYHTHT